ncbi:hypothetical protein TRIATDRAFT_317085 [Trichoderma atroviride IMI 206040]|uniref:Uncharacterized protein n=1 Tax=Hypocrea atroviridis (strain ATCC 20476 / IMI 206040) TaxID=452589 RepID=G9NPZ2_HYPAI|nr:uncharacterized protein TRIATDRAFT_317085 [Trichoderma atroviride IMI 206040]EHK47144.1 hypothetical protein TRIATDRAFT_317085 [Trichoderma atroviride IMI 206040]
MDSLIFRALMGLSFPQDSREEVQSESSVIKIQIDPVGSSEDMICVESLEQSQRGIDRIVGRFVPKNKFKSPPEIVENSATGFRAATRQWRDANPRPWCILEGYHIFDSGLSKSTIVSKAFRYMKKELAEISGQSDLLWRRTVRRLQLESDHDGVLRALIVCETYSAKSVATKIRNNSLLLAPTKRFLTEFRQLGEIYRPRRTSRNLEQIFQLQLHHANLNLFSDFLQSFATDYAAPRMFMFDSREVELRRWNLKAIMTDSHLYRQFSSLGAELTTTTESLLDIVLALEDSARQDVTELTVLGAEIRGCSKDIMTRLSRLSDDLDHNLQLLRLSKDMNQSGNVQMLTLLATIFLPLSLSAGVLSMQSRFKDLGDLLYDFFGVVVLLGAGVALLVTVMLLFSSMKELESRLFKYHWYKAILRPVILLTISGITFTLGALVLASFLVGMFKDVVLGAKILGYGIAAAIGALVVIPYGTLLVFWFPNLWEFGGSKKKKQSDVKSEPKGKEAAADGSQEAGVTIQADLNGVDDSSTPPAARAGDESPEKSIPNVTEVGP